MGLLTFSGMLNVSQFWPKGDSDADTAKIAVSLQRNSILYQPSPGAAAAPTTVFASAFVRSRAGRKPVFDQHGRMTVRLQGIDAPELHYPPGNLRQHCAESSANAFQQLLASAGPLMPCTVLTQVEEPNDVCDMYGRVVGELTVTLNNRVVNLNHWLVATGWAVPAFYTSMSNEEITTLLELGERARQSRKNNWRHYSSQVRPLDTTLRMRPPGSPLAPDKGPHFFPKLFRRQCQWVDAKAKGKTNATTLQQFLAQSSSHDHFFLTKEFLELSIHSARPERLCNALTASDRFKLRPGELVFQESPSTLFSADGTKITNW